MAKPTANAVDVYIAKQPTESHAVLQRVRRIIRKVLPGAEETISYQIPTYRLHGRAVVYFAGWKQHWSLYPVSELVRAALGPELESFQISKGTMRFPLAEPVPTKLVERIVRELVRMAGARVAKPKKSVRQDGGRRRTRG